MAKPKTQADRSQAQRAKKREAWQRQKARQRIRGREAYEEARRTGIPRPRRPDQFIRGRFQRAKNYRTWVKLGRPEGMRDIKPPRPRPRRSRPEPLGKPDQLPLTITRLGDACWDLLKKLAPGQSFPIPWGGRTANTQNIQEEAVRTQREEPEDPTSGDWQTRGRWQTMPELILEERGRLPRVPTWPVTPSDLGAPPPNWIPISSSAGPLGD